ncbi:MAG: SPOR domain-containing protein, partial [Pseudomonadota bacterium]
GRFPVGAVEDVRLASAADGSAAAAVSDVVSPRPSAPSVPAGATGGAVDLPGPAAARARARERIRRAQLQQAQAAATPGAGQGAGQGASNAPATATQANDADDEEPTGAIPRRVAAAAPPTAETAPRGAPVADLLFVQVAAFTSSDNASAMKNRLEPFGPSQVGLANVNGRRFYRVRVGPMTSRGEAEEVQARLSSAGYRDTVIVSQ